MSGGKTRHSTLMGRSKPSRKIARSPCGQFLAPAKPTENLSDSELSDVDTLLPLPNPSTDADLDYENLLAAQTLKNNGVQSQNLKLGMNGDCSISETSFSCYALPPFGNVIAE